MDRVDFLGFVLLLSDISRLDRYSTQHFRPSPLLTDEAVTRINDQQYRLYAVAGPETDFLLRLRPFSSMAFALTGDLLGELRREHDVETAVSLADTPDISELR